MSLVDNRVVSLSFDNKNFEQNVAESMATLDKLEQSLKLKDAARGLERIETASDKIDFSVMSNAVENVHVKFSALELVAVQALTKITDKALSAGAALIKSLSVDQLTSGFAKYEQELRSTQAIMNALPGTTLQSVEEALGKIQWYTDETSYNYSKMVDNIQKFTAQGIGLDKAVSEMEGIANMAAFTGASVEDASHAMDGFSKAMAAGYMSYQNWSWIKTAHMETMATKEAFIEAAKELGTLQRGVDGYWRDAKGNIVEMTTFTNTLSDKWLTSDVMEKTFQGFSEYTELVYSFKNAYEESTGEILLTSDAMDMLSDKTTDNEEKTKAYIKAYEKVHGVTLSTEKATKQLANWVETTSEKAMRAGQEYRTFADAINSVKDAVSSGWMTIYKQVFGDAEQSKELWTLIGDTLNEAFTTPLSALSKALHEWQTAGGFKTIISSVENLVTAVQTAVKPFKDALTNLFPPLTGERIYQFTYGLSEFIKQTTLSEDAVKGLNNVLQTLAKILSPLISALKFVVKLAVIAGVTISVLVNRFLALFSSASKIPELFKKIFGEERYNRIAESMSKILSSISDTFASLKKRIGDFFDNLKKSEKFQNVLYGILGVLYLIKETVLELITKGIEKLANFNLKGVGEFFTNIFNSIKNFNLKESLSKIGENGVLGFIGGIASKIGEAAKVALELAKTFITALVSKQGLDEHSPSRVAYGIGAFVVLGLVAGMLAASEQLRNSAFTIAGNLFTNLWTSIQDFVKKLDVSQVLLMGFAVALIIIFKKIGDSISKVSDTLFYNVKNITKSFAGLADALKKGVTETTAGLKTFFKSFKQGNTWKTILSVAVAIGALAGSIYLLVQAAKGDGDLLGATAVLAGSIIVLSAAVIAIGVLAKKDKIDLNGIIKIFTQFALVSLSVAASLAILSKCNFVALLGGIVALGLTIDALIKTSKKIKKADINSVDLLKFIGDVALIGAAAGAIFAISHIFGLATIAYPVAWVGTKIAKKLVGTYVDLSKTITKKKIDTKKLLEYAGSLAVFTFVIKKMYGVSILLGALVITAPIMGLGLMMVKALVGAILSVADNITSKQIDTNGLLKFAGSMALFVLALNALTPALLALGTFAIFKTDELVVAAAIVGALLLAFGVIGKMMSKSQEFNKGLTGFAASMSLFAIAISALVLPIMALGFLFTNEGTIKMAWAGVAAIAGFLLAFAGIAALFGLVKQMAVNMSQFGTAMISFAAAIGILAGVITLLTYIIPEDKLLSFVGIAGTLAVLMIALGAALSLASDVTPKALIGIVLMGLVIAELVAAMYQLQKADWKSLAAAAGGLITLMLAMALVTKIANGNLKGVGTMLLLSVAAIGFAGAIWILAKAFTDLRSAMTPEELSSMALSLGGFIAVMSLAIVVLGMLGLPALAGAGAIALLSVSMIGTAFAAKLFSEAMSSLVTALTDGFRSLADTLNYLGTTSQNILNGSEAFAAAITNVTTAVKNGLFDILKPIPEILLSIAGVLLLMNAAMPTFLLASGVILVVSGSISVLSSSIILLGNGLTILSDGLTDLGEVISKINNKISEVITSAKNAIEGFCDGIKDGLSKVWTKGKELAQSFLNGLNGKEGLDAHSPAWETIKSAGNAIAGFVKGIFKGKDEVKESGEETGKSFLSGLSEIDTSKIGETISGKIGDAVEKGKSLLSGETSITDLLGLNDDTSLLGEIKSKVSSIFDGGLFNVEDLIGDASSQFEDFTPSIDGMTGSIGALGSTTAQTSKSIEELMQEYNFGAGVVDKMNKKYKLNIALLTKSEDTLSSSDKLLKDFIRKEYLASDAGKKLAESGKTGAEYLEEEMKGMQALFDEMTSGIKNSISGTNWFEEVADEEQVYGEDLIINMQNHVDQINKWSENLKELSSRGISSSLMKYITDMGASGYKYVDALVNMSEESFEELNSLYSDIVLMPDEIANDVISDYVYQGAMAAAGYADGITPEAAEEAAREMGFASVDALAEALESDSAESASYRLGAGYTNDFVNGMLSEQYQLQSAGAALGNAVGSGLNEEIKKQDFKLPGRYICQGISDGIYENLHIPMQASAKLAMSIMGEFNRTVEIQSPSKKFMQSGRFIDLGLANGISRYAYLASGAAEELGEETSDNFNAALSPSSLVNLDSFDDPVITPILDLSKIKEGMSAINSMFEGERLEADFKARRDEAYKSKSPMFNVETNAYLGDELIYHHIDKKLGELMP